MSPVNSTNLDLCDRAVFADGPPHDEFRRLREEEPVVFFSEPDGPGFWGVFRYDDVVQVVKRHITYVRVQPERVHPPSRPTATSPASGC